MATYSSLDGFITNGKLNTISYANLSFVDYFQDIKFPMYNIIQDYLDNLEEDVFKVTLTDQEYAKYKYKPRLLSNYLYGSTEFFFVILALNGIATEKEFTSQTIKLLSADKMKELIEKIYTLEQESIQSYNSRRLKEYLEDDEEDE